MSNYTFLDLVPEFAKNEAAGWHEIAGFNLGHPLLNANGHISMSHVIFSGVAFVFIVGLGAVVRGKFTDKEKALIPEGKFTLRNMIETIFEGVMGMMADMMGEKQARKFFPLIATLSLWILFSNLMGLIPGLAPPTSNLNTNLAPALVIFIAYNIAGLREQGLVNYIKHFMGPVIFIAPLMFLIELVGHAFRPISLGVRLTGNMTGDHMVLGAFGNLAEMIMGFPIGLTIPFLFLGLMVCVIQTLVFALLSSVYIALAVEHTDH